MGFVSRGLDLNGRDLFTVAYNKVNLVVAVCALFWPGVIKQLVSLCDQFLRNDVFVNRAEICRQLVRKQCLVHGVIGKIPVFEHKGYKQSRISKV